MDKLISILWAEALNFVKLFNFLIPNFMILIFSIYWLYKISFSKNLLFEKESFFEAFKNWLFYLFVYYYGCIIIHLILTNEVYNIYSIYIFILTHYSVNISYNIMQILILLFFFLLIFFYLFFKIILYLIYFYYFIK